MPVAAVSFQESPTFLRPEQMRDDHIVQMMGSTARLRCRATGRPTPEILWYKDGTVLPDELSSSAPSEGSTSHWQLKLSELNMNDAGRYTCKVFNKVGAINFTYTVQVIGQKFFLAIFYIIRPIYREAQSSYCTLNLWYTVTALSFYTCLFLLMNK